MRRARWPAVAAAIVGLAGCSSQPRVEIELRVPAGEAPLRLADSVTLSVRDARGNVVSLRRASASAADLTLDAVPAGSGYVVELDASFGGDLVATGRSCSFALSSGRPAPTVPVYFSALGRFAATSSPAVVRSGAVAIPGGEMALIAGGAADGGPALGSSEVYDPRTGRFTAGPPLVAPRAGAVSARLPDGTVLVAGGGDDGVAGVESFSMDNFSPLASTFPADWFESAALPLGDGRLLVAGGHPRGDPPTPASFILTETGATVGGATQLVQPRARHTLTAAGSDRLAAVFAIGGLGPSGPVAAIELFDPVAETFSLTGADLLLPRYDHTATRLGDGRLLIAGGRGADGTAQASAETLDPATRTLRPTGSLKTARAQHTATVLPSGRVLLAGGVDASGAPTAAAELYDPALGPVGDFVPTAPLTVARAGHVAVPLCDGTVLFVGGGAGAEIYNPAP